MAVLARQSAEYQESHLYQNQTKNLSAFYIVLVVIAAACMVMRVCSRRIMGVGLKRDDWTFLAGSLLAEGLLVVSLIYSFGAGLGEHWVALTPDQKLLFPKLNYAYNILNLSCYPIIKISILLLYIRVFAVAFQFLKFCWAGIVFISAMCIANTLVGFFACTPVRSFFDASVPGKCIQDVPFYWTTAILNVVTDFYILILPIPVIWQLQIVLKRKIAISLIFVVGGLTFIVSIIRIVYYLDYTNEDPSYSFLGTAYATPAEVVLAIVVASAPTWRPVWAYSSAFASSISGHSNSSRSSFDFTASHKHALSVVHSKASSSSGGSGGSSREHEEEVSRKSSMAFVEDKESGRLEGVIRVPPSAQLAPSSGSEDELFHPATPAHVV